MCLWFHCPVLAPHYGSNHSWCQRWDKGQAKQQSKALNSANCHLYLSSSMASHFSPTIAFAQSILPQHHFLPWHISFSISQASQPVQRSILEEFRCLTLKPHLVGDTQVVRGPYYDVTTVLLCNSTEGQQESTFPSILNLFQGTHHSCWVPSRLLLLEGQVLLTSGGAAGICSYKIQLCPSTSTN